MKVTRSLLLSAFAFLGLGAVVAATGTQVPTLAEFNALEERVSALEAELFPPPSPSPSPSPEPSPSPDPAQVCATGGGVRVPTGDDLAALVLALEPSTYCLAEGTHVLSDRVRAEAGDAFIGAGRDLTFIRPTINANGGTTPGHGFVPFGDAFTGTVPITYESFDIGGFTAAPTADCNGGCGTALWDKGDPVLGGGMIVQDVRCRGNGTACIAHGGGNVVADNLDCYGNGFHPDTLKGDFRSSACIKLGEGSLHLTNSWIHDNTGDGLWADWCGNCHWLIEDNLIEGNGRAGIVWEYSGHFVQGDHAIIRNNIIRNNGARGDLTGSSVSAGVFITSGTNITIEGNTFGGNKGWTPTKEPDGFVAVRIYDPPTRCPTVCSGNIVIWNNTLSGDRIHSCTRTGVTCEGNV